MSKALAKEVGFAVDEAKLGIAEGFLGWCFESNNILRLTAGEEQEVEVVIPFCWIRSTREMMRAAGGGCGRGEIFGCLGEV